MPPLTRAANLDDFPGCVSVPQWQQGLADEAYAQLGIHDAALLCLNWGAGHFTPPPHETFFHHIDFWEGPTVPTPAWPRGIVYAFSVLDRVPSPLAVLRQWYRALPAESLVVCTFALWDVAGRDVARGHELRARIYNRHSWQKLVNEARALGYETPGGIDLRYHGDLLGDHSLGSLVLTKGATHA